MSQTNHDREWFTYTTYKDGDWGMAYDIVYPH